MGRFGDRGLLVVRETLRSISMKFAKALFVFGLIFALAPLAVISCTSGGDEGAGGGGGSGGDASGSAGKGGSASGGSASGGSASGGSASGGSGGSSSSGGSGGKAVGGAGGVAAGGAGGVAAGGAGGVAAGGAGGMAAGGAGGNVAAAPKFAADIAPILKAKCSVCHGKTYETTDGAYARLMGEAGGACAPQKRMVVGDAANSLVVKKVKGTAGICGGKMPKVGDAACTGDACLSTDQIAKLEAWINAGALKN